MAASVPGHWILLCCGAACQAVQQYVRGGGFVVPLGYRTTAVLGAGSDPYRGFVMESASAVVVALRGTKNIFDLFTDFNWSQISYPYFPEAGSAHRGFIELYERTLRRQLLAAIKRLSPRKRLVLSGHSLGGALATLAAPDLARRTRFRPPHVYTYGSPKVGNAEFAAAYDRVVGHSMRIINRNDLVALFPPSEGGDLYVPVGKRLAVSFLYANPLNNHDIRRYAAALGSLFPFADKRLRELSPGFLP